MEIVTKNEGEAVALAAALQRLSPTPVVAGRIPAVRGGAVNEVTRMLAKACIAISPMEKAIADGIISGQIVAAEEPHPRMKVKAKTKSKKVAKKVKAKFKAKKKVVKLRRKR